MERAVIVCLKITDISYLKSRQNTPTSVVDEQVKAMLRDQVEQTSDMNVMESLEVSDLNLETVHKYRNRHRFFKPSCSDKSTLKI